MNRQLQVFVENEPGRAIKNVHDERTLTYLGSRRVARAYPYPYGFVLDTRNDDGDHLDCYLLTEQPLCRGDIVVCEPIGLMEQTEAGEQDHNILAVLPGERGHVDGRVRARLTEFVRHVFDDIPGREVKAGRFLGVAAAWELIERCRAAARA